MSYVRPDVNLVWLLDECCTAVVQDHTGAKIYCGKHVHNILPLRGTFVMIKTAILLLLLTIITTTITIMNETLTDTIIIVIVVMIRHNVIYHDYRCHLSSIIVIIVTLTHDHLNIAFSIVEVTLPSSSRLLSPSSSRFTMVIHRDHHQNPWTVHRRNHDINIVVFTVISVMISSWSWPRHSRHFFQNTSRKSNNAAKCSKAVETPFSCQVTLTAFENELGVQAPVGFWDPAGFTADGDVAVFKRRRSVELKHGRISMMATMGDLDALLIHVFEDTTEDATSTFPKAGPNFKHRTAWLLVSWHDRCNKYVWWHVFGFSFEQLLCCCFVFHGSRDLWNWMLHDVGMFCADAFARIHYSRSHWQAARDSVYIWVSDSSKEMS